MLIGLIASGPSLYYLHIVACELQCSRKGTLAGSGSPQLPTTGFQLESGQSITVPSFPGWSGRIWARTGCSFDALGAGTCLTGDCGGRVECDGNGAAPPASLFEITLSGTGSNIDFYDVSFVDGYNLPLLAAPRGVQGQGSCNVTGCDVDINVGCPKELQVVMVGGEGGSAVVVACKSACEAFGLDQYCCSGAFANPTTCRPSFYSSIFKSVCPKAYTYAFDDGTSTFTCTNALDYHIVFCPTTKRPDTVGAIPIMGTNNQKTVMSSSGSAENILFPILHYSALLLPFFNFHLL